MALVNAKYQGPICLELADGEEDLSRSIWSFWKGIVSAPGEMRRAVLGVGLEAQKTLGRDITAPMSTGAHKTCDAPVNGVIVANRDGG